MSIKAVTYKSFSPALGPAIATAILNSKAALGLYFSIMNVLSVMKEVILRDQHLFQKHYGPTSSFGETD